MKKIIKKTLVALAVAGALALPQGIDYMVNGSYESTRIGENVIHEYGDKIVVGGRYWPWGTKSFDYGKDGKLDRIESAALPRVPFSMEIEKDSELFRSAQEGYEKLMREYEKI